MPRLNRMMTEWEHTKLVNDLEKIYVGKTTIDNTKIIRVFVDYRYDCQNMNRLEDDYGNIYFINEFEEEIEEEFKDEIISEEYIDNKHVPNLY